MHPILFRIGSFPVYSYGVMLFAAFVAAIIIMRHELVKRGISSSSLYLLAAILALAGVVGARLFYILGHIAEFKGNWVRVFDINTLGMIYYGGLLLAIPVGIIAIRRLKLPTGVVADAVGLALPLSLAIARVGCFLNGCCGGKTSGLPWAVTVPGTANAVHPTQLYEAVLDLAVFGLLLVLRKYLHRDWDIFLISLAVYAAIRFAMEFFRFHTSPGAAVFFQALSAAIFVVSLGLFWWRHRAGQLPEAGEAD